MYAIRITFSVFVLLLIGLTVSGVENFHLKTAYANKHANYASSFKNQKQIKNDESHINNDEITKSLESLSNEKDQNILSEKRDYYLKLNLDKNGNAQGVIANSYQSPQIGTIVQKTAFSFGAAINFDEMCHLSKCGYFHPACEPKTLGPHCPVNAQLININDYKAQILNLHNAKRNLYAGGGGVGRAVDANHRASYIYLRPAARMVEMQWSVELAALATQNIRNCRNHKDICHNTKNFPYSGQNIRGTIYDSDNLTIKKLIKLTFNAWNHYARNLTMNFINHYSQQMQTPLEKISIIIKDTNTHVGCAAILFQENKHKIFLLACNYANQNIAGAPIYRAGATASECKSGKSFKYKNLCNINEYNLMK